MRGAVALRAAEPVVKHKYGEALHSISTFSERRCARSDLSGAVIFVVYMSVSSRVLSLEISIDKSPFLVSV